MDLATERERDQLESGPVREPISAGRIGLSAIGAGRRDVHADGAILLHELDTRTATRDTTNDGVNDPIRAPGVRCRARRRGRSRHRWCSDIGMGVLGRVGTERRLAVVNPATYAASSGCLRSALFGSQG